MHNNSGIIYNCKEEFFTFLIKYCDYSCVWNVVINGMQINELYHCTMRWRRTDLRSASTGAISRLRWRPTRWPINQDTVAHVRLGLIRRVGARKYVIARSRAIPVTDGNSALRVISDQINAEAYRCILARSCLMVRT